MKTLRYLAAGVVFAAAPALAQQPAPAPAPVGPAVGEMAPDFEFDGVSRYGSVTGRLKLSDFHGKAVVLAFFPKARTKG